MRECLFFVADSTMAEVVDGFLSQGHFEGRIGCCQFEYDFQEDMLVGVRLGNTDGGLHVRAHQLLQENGFLDTHEHAVVMLDKKFGGELPAAAVRKDILKNLQANGWADGRADVVVIDPELETWIWQDSVHVEKAVGHRRPPSLRESLKNDKEWPNGHDKPLLPKTLLTNVCKRNGTPFSAAIHRAIVENVSVKQCKDGAFQQLVTTLRRWFPLEVAQ